MARELVFHQFHSILKPFVAKFAPAFERIVLMLLVEFGFTHAVTVNCCPKSRDGKVKRLPPLKIRAFGSETVPAPEVLATPTEAPPGTDVHGVALAFGSIVIAGETAGTACA